jgi:hypothetical protein
VVGVVWTELRTGECAVAAKLLAACRDVLGCCILRFAFRFIRLYPVAALVESLQPSHPSTRDNSGCCDAGRDSLRRQRSPDVLTAVAVVLGRQFTRPDNEPPLVAGFLTRGILIRMVKKDTSEREAWRQRPWAIVLLILLAISFGGELVLGASPLAMIGSGLLLFGWTTMLIMSLRGRKSPHPPA